MPLRRAGGPPSLVPGASRLLLGLCLALTASCGGGPGQTARPSELMLEFAAGTGPRTPEGARLVGSLRLRVTRQASGPAALREPAALQAAARGAVLGAVEELLAAGVGAADLPSAVEAPLRRWLGEAGVDLVALLAVSLEVPGDSARARLAPTTDLRLLLIGLDGHDWDVAEPLMRQGRLPALSSIVARGTRARLATISPMLSPVIWTSMATGRQPQEHGILDFLGTDAAGRPVPVTSNLRRTKAFWNVLSDAGVDVGVVAWWATWPAEAVNGFLVSDRVAYQLFSVDDAALPVLGKVHPPALWSTVAPLVMRPSEVTDADLAPFLDTSVATPPSASERQLLEQFRAVVASATSYARIGLALQDSQHPRVGAYYFQAPDTAAHLFMRHAEPPLPEVDPSAQRRFAHVVERVYEMHDRILAQFLERADDRTVVLVVSDHGFRSGAARPRAASQVESPTAADWHDRFGVLALAGPGVRAGHEVAEASILDILPTMLALLGMPISDELAGRVLDDALEPEFLAAHPVRHVPTFEDGAERAASLARIATPSAEDRAILESLVAIGYVSPSRLASPADGGAARSAPGDDGFTANAHNNLGTILLNQGDVDAALAEFRLAVAAEPRFVQARVNLAHALLRLERAAEAEAELQSVLAEAPGSGRALTLLSALLRERGSLAEAERLARQALAQDDRAPVAWQALAGVLESSGREGEAVQAWQRAADLDPENPEPVNALGNLAERAGDYRAAATSYAEALRRDPTFAGGYNNLALQHQRLGHWDEALRVYEEGRRRLPGSSILLNNMATWHHRRALGAQAAAAAARARGATAEASAADSEAHARAEDAERLYLEAAAANPLDPAPLNNLGALLPLLGRAEEQVPLYERALALDPGHVDARHNLGEARLRAGLWSEAHDQFQRVLAKQPGHVEALRLDALALVRLGRGLEALQQLQTALAAAPRQARLLAALGAVHDELGQRPEACRRYRESLAVDPSQADVASRLPITCAPN